MSESIGEVLAREAAEAEARAEAEERGEVAPARGQRGRKRASDPSQVYSVRIPVSRLRELRQIAEQLDVQPTVLIRQWVLERLDQLAAASAAANAKVEVRGQVVNLGPRRKRDSGDVQSASDAGQEQRYA
jgi:hypothetical protein